MAFTIEVLDDCGALNNTYTLIIFCQLIKYIFNKFWLDGAQKGGYLHNKVLIYYMSLLEGLFASIALSVQSLISLKPGKEMPINWMQALRIKEGNQSICIDPIMRVQLKKVR